jgi:hypothetical protein
VPTFTRVRKGGEPAFQECPQSDLSHVQFIRAAMAKPIEALSLVKPPASKSFVSQKFRLFLLNRREGDNLDRRCGIARDFSRHYPSRDPQITERTRALPSAQRLRHNSSVPKRTRQIRLPLSSAHERAQNERKTRAKRVLRALTRANLAARQPQRHPQWLSTRFRPLGGSLHSPPTHEIAANRLRSDQP